MAEGMLERNIDAIADYLSGGESARTERRLGFEVEHFVLDAQTHALVPYEAYECDGVKRPGVEDVLNALLPLYDGATYTIDEQGRQRPIGLKRSGAPVTIEPGAQLEVSIGPCCTVAELEQRYRYFRADLDPLLQQMGYELVSLGYHPTACANEIPLIPKHRYDMMNRHFEGTGRHGKCMMRASASTQVSIDFIDERDCMDKMFVATAMGPLLYFVFDNSPIFEGQRVDAACAVPTSEERIARSGLPVPPRMARASIWNDVDPSRSMPAPFLFEPDPSYRTHAAMLMDRPPILTVGTPGDDSTSVGHGFETAAQVFSDKLMTTADIEHVLSMFFFDVRLKRYIEIRQPDSLPLPYALSFVAMCKGIFYNQRVLELLADEFAGVTLQQVALAKADLQKHGYDAIVYGQPAGRWLEELLFQAREGLAMGVVGEDAYLKPLEQLVQQRTTLVDLAKQDD